LENNSTVVVGVSPDPIAALQKFRAKHDLNFTLLSDIDHTVAETYGAWGEKKRAGRVYMGILRSHFVIDGEGRVLDSQIKVSPADSVQRAIQTCCPS
jgi:peroxiredoxin Q/BCP